VFSKGGKVSDALTSLKIPEKTLLAEKRREKVFEESDRRKKSRKSCQKITRRVSVA